MIMQTKKNGGNNSDAIANLEHYVYNIGKDSQRMKVMQTNRLRFVILLVYVLILVLISAASTFACSAVWYPDLGITGAVISQPTNGMMVAANEQLQCGISAASDNDRRVAINENPMISFPPDAFTNEDAYTWTATDGTFPNGNKGLSVLWKAPNKGVAVVISCTVNDDAVIPQGEYGNRNDTLVRSVNVTVVKAEIKSVIFTSDHGVLTNYITDFNGSGGTVYSPRGWVKNGANNPISHTQGIQVHAGVTVKVEPSGLNFSLVGVSGFSPLNFPSTQNTSTGNDQSIAVTSTSNVPAKVDTQNQSIDWTISISPGFTATQTSGSHKMYITWAAPGGGSTEKRISWVCMKANGATTLEACADGLQNGVAAETTFGSGDIDGWELLDRGSGDCDNQARCMTYAVLMLGAGPAEVKMVRASNNAGAGGCLDFETRPCLVDGSENLCLDFYNGGNTSNMNQYEGCCVTAGHYYAITPKLKATDDYDMLKNRLAPSSVTQRWCWWDANIPWWHPCNEPSACPPIP